MITRSFRRAGMEKRSNEITKKDRGGPPRDGDSLGTKNYGGESGIRTHGRISPTHAFQACSLNRSDISPPCLGVSSVTNRRRGGKRTGVAQEFLVRAGGNKSATGLLHFCTLFRGSAIGSTPAFGAGYPGSSPGPGANLSFLFNHLKQAL